MKSLRVSNFLVVCWTTLSCFVPFLVRGQTAPAQITLPPIRELLVSATLNGQKVAEGIEAIDVNGLGVLLTRSDFDRLGLVGVLPRIVIRGNAEYVALSRTPGLKATLNFGALELAVVADVGLFAGTALSFERERAMAPTRETGAFVNYDVSGQREGRIDTYNGFVELVGFTPWGSLISTGIVTYVNGVTNAVRLDTAFQRDFRDTRTRLRVGDSATVAGQFGSSVRFGGVQFGTEDAVDPRFVWRPLLSFAGSATVPSTVDVFLNSGLQRRFEVQPGPFSVENIATLAGRGSARMVVRDATGREVVIEQPFFTVPGQLRQGVSRYSLSAGWLRDAYALDSNQYGPAVAAAYWRYGLTHAITTELRAEGQHRGPASVAGSILVPFGSGLSISASAAASRAFGKHGATGGLAYNFSGPRFSFGAQWDTSDAAYRTLGGTETIAPPRHRMATNASVNLGPIGSLSAAYVRAESFGRSVTQQATLNHFYPISKEWKLSSSFSHTLSTPRFWSATLGLSWYGGNGLSAGVTGRTNCDSLCDRDGTTTEPQAYIASRADGYTGLNWQLDTNRNRGRAKGEWLTDFGALSAEAYGGYKRDTTRGVRLGGRGALAFMDGTFAAGQPISDSFVMVRTPEAAGLPISGSNARGVTLDGRGTALLTRVIGYEPVTVGVAQEALPINVVSSAKPVTLAVPAKAGAVARIAARKTAPATFTLVDLNRKPVMPGINVEVGDEKTKVGLDGLVYLEVLRGQTNGIARQNGRRCSFIVPAPPANEIFPNVGEIQCDLRRS